MLDKLCDPRISPPYLAVLITASHPSSSVCGRASPRRDENKIIKTEAITLLRVDRKLMCASLTSVGAMGTMRPFDISPDTTHHFRCSRSRAFGGRV